MFFLLQVLAVLAVVFGVAVVLTGRAGGMSDEGQDLASVGIPRDRAMTPDDVIGLRFALALRGYRMNEVDDALDRLAAEIAARDEAIARLRAELEEAPGEPATDDAAYAPAAGTGQDERWAAFAPPRYEEPDEAEDEVEAEVEEEETVVATEPLSPPPLPETSSTAPAWATARRSADDYIASDATGEVPEGTEVDVPTTPEGWQALDPTIAVETDPAAPTFVEPPSPFRPEVPDIPAYDPWAVTPRSRYTDGPTYVEVEHDDDDADPVEGIAEHHTGYAPPPPGGEGAPVAGTGGEGANDPADVAAAERAVEDAASGAFGGGPLPGAGGVPGAGDPGGAGADEPDDQAGDEPGEPSRPWQS